MPVGHDAHLSGLACRQHGRADAEIYHEAVLQFKGSPTGNNAFCRSKRFAWHSIPRQILDTHFIQLLLWCP